jgi:maltooligosyltrehalose trehalohydrolase
VTPKRRRAIGAEIVDGGVHFRVWAPAWKDVSVVINGHATPLEPEAGGHFSAFVEGAGHGTRYRIRLGDDDYPDPASRHQPDGPHGDSVVVDPTFVWKSKPPAIDDRIISEIHIGTFTAEGTFASAIGKLPLVADAGINTLEVMPVHEFPGRFGWGYDGVDLWAPTRLYGTPDDFRRFVDAAHEQGLAVILDVVYNHFGPDGCYVGKFTPAWFTDRYPNDWGASINFDEAGVREFFAENAAYWIDEFRLDGLRLDATQSIQDASPRHVIAEITERARAAAGDREIYIVAENEPQDVRLLNEFGVDGMWNDDWHHSARVALTGEREAYYTDYLGGADEFASMARFGFLYQGQWYGWQKQGRGTPSHDVAPRRMVCFLENHDQIANSATGARLHQLTRPGKLRAMTALLMLAPQTPMLFQGQEFAASSPFLYFADHKPELAALVANGRREFLEQFPSIHEMPAPEERRTFESCKLDWRERDANADVVAFHRELIGLRRTMPRDRPETSTLRDDALLLRWLPCHPERERGAWEEGRRESEGSARRPPARPLAHARGDSVDLLLVINLGPELHLDPVPQPLLAPPLHKEWSVLWSTVAVENERTLPAECAVLFGVRAPS